MKYVLIMLLSFPVFSQNYGLGTGMIIPKDRDYQIGYYIEVDYIIKTNQERKYLNNLLFGFYNGGYMTKMQVISAEKELEIKNECNCTETDLNLPKYNYSQKRMTRAIGLVFGAETFKNLYLITGITSSKHITKISNEETNSFYTTHIDAGVKYYIKYKNSYLVPTLRFNPETWSIGINYSR